MSIFRKGHWGEGEEALCLFDFHAIALSSRVGWGAGPLGARWLHDPARLSLGPVRVVHAQEREQAGDHEVEHAGGDL